MADPIRIVIADDHPLFREGVRLALSIFDDCEVVGECSNADEALATVSEKQPDITLLDIGMPGGGIEAARRIAQQCPHVRIIMLTVSERESDVINSLEVGATGYVLKGIPSEEFVTVIKSVHQGDIYVSPSLSANARFQEKIQNTVQRPRSDPDLSDSNPGRCWRRMSSLPNSWPTMNRDLKTKMTTVGTGLSCITRVTRLPS